MERVENLIKLLLEPDLGPVSVKYLLDAFGDADGVLGAPEAAIRQIKNLKKPQVRAAIHARQTDPRRELDHAAQLGVQVMAYDDPLFPEGLRDAYAAPFLLYVKGRIRPEDHRGFGIVGTRAASRYGLEQARYFGDALARAGFAVVSGLARGVDSAAHRGALDAGGRTIAVLGCGLAHMYPLENRDLAAEIAAAGAVVSEFPLSLPPAKDTFPRRNRIIAGWSAGVLVVEAPRRSGALITANYATKMGRPVFAVPGRIDNPGAAGGHELIRDGASIATGLEDILAEISGQNKPRPVRPESASRAPRAPRQNPPPLPDGNAAGDSPPPRVPEETAAPTTPRPSRRRPAAARQKPANHDAVNNDADGDGGLFAASSAVPATPAGGDAADRRLLAALDDIPAPVDHLVAATGLSVGELNTRLMLLELRRAVVRHSGNLYSRPGR